MKAIAAVAALAFLATCHATALRFNHRLDGEIKQCKDQNLECPAFELVSENNEKGYEVRKYAASKWVSVMKSGMDLDAATSENFMKLFEYISGQNDQGVKIAMTAPVKTKVEPGVGPNCESNFTTSFFVPKSKWENTPVPTGDGVYLEEGPVGTLIVRAFGGYANSKDFIREAMALEEAIGDSYKFVREYYYTAGYDSPYKFWDRRNEVAFVLLE